MKLELITVDKLLIKFYNMSKEIQDGICDYIKELMSEACDECKSELAHFIAFQSVVFGSMNIYEGVGILECVKRDYIEACEEVLMEDEEDE